MNSDHETTTIAADNREMTTSAASGVDGEIQ